MNSDQMADKGRGFARNLENDHSILIGDIRVRIDWGQEDQVVSACNAAHQKAIMDVVRRAVDIAKSTECFYCDWSDVGDRIAAKIEKELMP